MSHEFKTKSRLKPENAATILLSGLQDVWGEYLFCRGTFRSKPSRSSVHHLRTSIRKLEAVLQMLEAIAPSKHQSILFDDIDRERKSLSALRDAQVQKKDLSRSRREWLNRKKFNSYLKKIETKEEKAALTIIRAQDQRKRVREFSKIESSLVELLVQASPRRKSTLMTKLQHHLGDQHLNLQRQVLSLKPKRANRFHKLRVATKNCLYEIEAAKTIVSVAPDFKNKISRFKDKLGDLQDQVAFVQNAKRFFKKTKAHPEPKKEIAREILARQKEIISSPNI